MRRAPGGAPRGWPGIRIRLALALALALAPVLCLSAVQSALSYENEVKAERRALVGAAELSAATERARTSVSLGLLRALVPSSGGPQCATQLADAAREIPAFANLVRFDRFGRVSCAAAQPPPAFDVGGMAWFRALALGKRLEMFGGPGVTYASEPVVLASVRAVDGRGAFAGALTAIIPLKTLRPLKSNPALPTGVEIALMDAQGRQLSTTSAAAFPPIVAPPPGASGASTWLARGRGGDLRDIAVAPILGRMMYVVLSTPTHNALLWARLNPISAVLLPLLAFGLAVSAVWIVADRGVVRWIAYLQRLALLYARGRYSVRPARARHAPPEIRELAATLDTMAKLIAERDRVLRETLEQKDTMMREIHHRVKNNLQVISSLLNMQQRALSEPAAQMAMADTRQRIAALALIYRALYQSPDLRRVDLRDFLEELIPQLMLEAGKGGRIQTQIRVEPLAIDPDRLAPLALFAVEAITNARKHGLGDTGGCISVTCEVSEGWAELAISDGGSGASANPTARVGVGRTLMEAFARQLRGKVDFAPNPDGGLTTCLKFPTQLAGRVI